MSRELKAIDELENTYIDERVAWLLPQFEAIAPYKLNQRKKGVPNENLIGWERLAAIEAKNLKTVYPDERPEDEKEYGTALRQITALKKALKSATKTDLKDHALFNPVNTIITHFGNALSYQFASYKERQNTRYRGTVTERREKVNRIEIDLTDSLKYAHNILTDIKNGQDANWLDVSCAIALATGRRMAEVHLSAIFELIDEYTVTFTGQLKGKSRKVRQGDKAVSLREVAFKIPTLLPADLVCFALEWLNKKGKRFDKSEDPERVNRRFSKTLNEACKQWEIFPNDERTYHKFRAAYLRAAIVNDGNVDPYDFTDFAKEVLGDDDESTINAYKRYEIKPKSITRV
ncbi:MAG: protelomerase family protein [Nostoc sp. DedSLP03]|uniref:protelomerase family protein n=1 Tax=Nostoc sp. DedSLP03 TaxID=3075400 RepID=UPI002AD26AAE|nr:protelomerase family protein [Nostoc sp. DedSLP03]MDZ7970397.1 protelomerase family protein [Nostoc sp. DedSLP03]